MKPTTYSMQFVRITVTLVFLCLMCALLAPASRAQETGGVLEGRVYGPDSRPLYGAGVVLVHLPSGTRYALSTLKDGHYYFSGLRIGGPYQLEVSFVGMEKNIQTIGKVSLGEPQAVNISLKQAVVTLGNVVITSARVRNTSYGAGENISRNKIQQMPTISRSITDITRLVPQGSRDNSFAGTSFRYNNVTLDGAINNDAIGFSPSLGGKTGTSNMPGSSTGSNPVSLDAIEDMQVYLAPFDVRIGNFTGGSINAVTRSGTNELHGAVYVYGRNATMVGTDKTGTEKDKKMPSAFYDYQTGFRAGFPIIKNKLFFFTNEEITRRQEPVQQVAGSPGSSGILSTADADNIRNYTIGKYNFDPGTAAVFNTYARSYKFFNRLDWNINDRNQLAIRNNTIRSEALLMERDQLNFRFSSIGFVQKNNQTSTVAELKTRLNERISNSLIAGFTNIHDYREPLGNPEFPQVQIVGRTPGSTIFFGTDREASIFNFRQRTFEITDNVTVRMGKHILSFGTHNELYKIDYGFVNSWNGRVTYQSIEDYLTGNPQRVQGNYHYSNNSREYLLQHPPATFSVNFFSGYIQDEIRISSRFKVTPGFRLDWTSIPDKATLGSRTKEALQSPYFGTTYYYTPLRQISQQYLSRPLASPRIGFRAELNEKGTLILRGGTGIFTGRIPLAWIGYAYYNTGTSFGSIDMRTNTVPAGPFLPGTDPLLKPAGSPYQGIAGFAYQQGRIVDDPNAGQTQIDVIDNNFVMPSLLRNSLTLEFTDAAGFNYQLEGLYSKTIRDVKFQQINLIDNPSYYAYDAAEDLRKQPVFGGSIDPGIANAYLLTNTSKGFKYSITGRISKTFENGFNFSAAYTYGKSKDVSNGIRNSMESNWQLNQALHPNDPGLAYSNFDIRHRAIATLAFARSWSRSWRSVFSLFFSAQSGSPFTYGFVNYTPQNTPQQVALAYIPARGETVNFFTTQYAADGSVAATPEQQAEAFDGYIDGNAYLRSRRGNFTERNTGRTPWNVNADFHFEQLFTWNGKRSHTISFTLDIMNLTNLLNRNWGWFYFSPNTYNGTASIGLQPYVPARSAQGYPLYRFTDPGKPYSVDPLASRWQMQTGLRYSF